MKTENRQRIYSICREAALLMQSSFLLLLLLSNITQAEVKIELLWPDGAPGAKGDQSQDKPTLIRYLANADLANADLANGDNLAEGDNTTGSAVVICPGGGYGNVAIDHEGHDVAHWLNSLGVSAFIVDL